MAARTGHARKPGGSYFRALEWRDLVLLVSAVVSALAVIPALLWLYPIGVIIVLAVALAATLAALRWSKGDGSEGPPLGTDYEVTVGRSSGGRRTFEVFSVPAASHLASPYVDWAVFGKGIELLKDQIRGYNGHIDVQACIGINDAGLVMATFLGSAVFGSPHLGYVRYHRAGPAAEIHIDPETMLPDLKPKPALLLADFKLKSGRALRGVVSLLRETYDDPRIYLAAFGAQTKWPKAAEIDGIEDLTAAPALEDLDIELFVACTMGDPGIEPPLMLK